MNSGWDGYSGIAKMRGTVVVSYASSVGGFGPFSSPKSDPDQPACVAAQSASNESLDFHSDPKSVQNGDSASPSGKNLSSRQREVLNLIVRGYSNKEIARALDLAEGTVKIHVAVLFSKLGVHRRAALAAAGASLLPQRFGALGMSLVGSASR